MLKVKAEVISSTPLQPTIERGNQAAPSPLSKNEKLEIVKKLCEADKNILKDALLKTSFSQQRVPNSLLKLASLQSAYLINYDNEIVRSKMEEAIIAQIDSEGFKQFQQLLDAKFDEGNWSSGFLVTLAKNANISIEPEPLVQLAIENGKIYWRIMKGEKPIYARHNHLEEKDTWYMTWEQFRKFKDGGKRSGTVAVTQPRFVKHFEEAHKHQAATAWRELKEKGVLNQRDRLSDAWLSISNVDIKLESIEVITYQNVQDCLNSFENKPIIENDFISCWFQPYQHRAKLIWEELKEKGILCKIESKTNEKKYVLTAKRFTQRFTQKKFMEFSKGLQPSYDEISEVLQAITSNTDYQELIKIANSNNFSIYRPVRSPKTWRSTGKVQNKFPTDDDYKVKPWDVGIYSDLEAHSPDGDGLDLDHIPSCDTLRKAKKSIFEEFTQDESRKKWWSIAIAHTLHTQGVTYMQKSAVETPILDEVSHYLEIIEKPGGKIPKSRDEYLEALGAFRYLYRRQVKKPAEIEGVYVTGCVPYLFFKQYCCDAKLDQLFHDCAVNFINRREGLESTEEADDTLPPTKLSFSPSK